MYSGGTRQMYVDFNATGTSSVDWMSQAKIVDSTYTDIISDVSLLPDLFNVYG